MMNVSFCTACGSTMVLTGGAVAHNPGCPSLAFSTPLINVAGCTSCAALRAQLAAERAAREQAERERDQALSNLEGITRNNVLATGRSLREGDGWHANQSWTCAGIAELRQQRDAAEAEVARLVKERDEARAERDACMEGV